MTSKTNIKNQRQIPGYTLVSKIHESDPYVIYRAVRESDDYEMVIKTISKEYPKKEDVLSLKREFRITSKLNTKGVVDYYALVEHSKNNVAIIMEPFGVSLKDFLDSFTTKRCSFDDFFYLALALVETFSFIHEHGIIHKKINTENILVNEFTKEIRLIDFSDASELLNETIKNVSVSTWDLSTLPYISPEQTGRINRDVDYRSDFYSLGVCFYQMLTGHLPFSAMDPIEWVHAIVSWIPEPLSKKNPNVPTVLSNLVLKLLSKNAEDRYQSSYGLVHDLKKCQQILKSGEYKFDFELGEADVSKDFHIPQKLYGREVELEALTSRFENAVHGSSEFSLVSGYSGIGKTALVNELGRFVLEKQGYLIQGKFEQFKQNAPYSTMSEAFGDLIEQILGEPVERFELWKDNLRNALGENASLLTDLIEELEFILGPQKPTPQLSPDEFQKLFYKTFIQFLNAFATKEHPLVIFIDDLQWSDVPTLNLIKELVTSHELEYLYIIGAYRNNEVDATHPLSLVLREIQSQRFVEEIKLEGLAKEAFYKILEETLFCSKEKAIELGNELYDKTGGNPFFFIQLLNNLNDSQIVHFDVDSATWIWDREEIKKQNFSDNVVNVLIENQKRLSPSTQETICMAACIGTTFDLKTLAYISDKSLEDIGSDLFEALRLQMVYPLKDSYKYITDKDESDDALLNEFISDLDPNFKFYHDRIQQAAYAKISDVKKQQYHIEIGELLLNQTTENDLEDKIITIVNHLNEGGAFIQEKSKENYAELNLKAAIRAKLSSAYDTALDYLKISENLLGEFKWEDSYQLNWEIFNELQDCLYLTGNWDLADKYSNVLLEKSKSSVEKGLVLSKRTRQYATTQRMSESILAAYQGLEILGIEMERTPNSTHVKEELNAIDSFLKKRSVESLIDLPELTDEKAKIANQLLMEIFPAAFLSGTGDMFPYVVLKSVNVAISFGNSPESAFAYAAFGMLLCGYFEDTAKGYEFGKLGVKLNQKLDDKPLRARIIYVYAMFIHHWSNHWSSMTSWFKKGIEAGYESGDLLYLAYSAQDCIIWDPKLELDYASKEHAKLLEIVKECEYKDSYDSGSLFLQMQLNFQGLTHRKFEMTNDSFNEVDCVQGMKDRGFMTGVGNYTIYKAEIHLMYNDYEGALPFVIAQEKRASSVMALPQMVRFQIVSFLVYASILESSDKETRKLFLERMYLSQKRMARWSLQCEDNFEHLNLFMKAELARVSKKNEKALMLYERAISRAHASGFLRDEAMCNERTGDLLVSLQLFKAAEGYIREAHYLYYRWGAYRKVEDLEYSYPSIHFSTKHEKKQLPKNENKNDISLSFGPTSDLDILSILKASQEISGELVLEKLLDSTLQVLIENAGANVGLIIELVENKMHVRSQIRIDDSNLEQFDTHNENLVVPKTLVNTALRRNEAIVLENACELNSFSSDIYIKKRKPISVLCVPLTIRGKRNSVVYLENNLIRGAFTRERIKIIKLLAAQASISMENSKIYERQNYLLKAQERFVPIQFLKHLGHNDITKVALGDSVMMEMSVLFTDILNFTPLVEGRSPNEVIHFLNRLFNKLGAVITEWNGFIDSYAGDQIMALFPLPTQQAVKGAVKMMEALRVFNLESKEYNFPPIEMGVGINSGPLVLGTMGAVERMQCSVLGDTVNLASRIEQLTRKYGAKCLIGEHTYNNLENPKLFSTRMVDYVAVKGKGIAIKLYELLDAESEENKLLKETTKIYLEKGIKFYLERKFDEAIKQFKEALVIDAEDIVLKMFLRRSEKYLINPPDSNWKGFEDLQEK